MERQFLENFGLEKAQIDTILNEHSKDIGAKVNEIQELKTQIQNLETASKEFEEKLNSANSTITTLKNSNKDNESLQQKITDYQNQIKQMQTSFDLERKNNAIINSLRENDFIDPELALHLIDTEKVIKANDGSYSGLSEQIEAITNNEKYNYLRKTPKGDNETVVIPDVNRGGYDPSAGGIEPHINNSQEEKSTNWGEIIGKQREAEAQSRKESADNFWNSLPQV